MPPLLGWYGWDIRLSEAIPPSISELVLRDCDMDTEIPHRNPREGFYAIRSFLLREVGGFPALRSLSVVVGRHPERPDWAQLQELGRRQEIVVRIMQLDGRDVD